MIIQDENGDFHFNGIFRNADDVRRALNHLAQQETYADLVAADGEKILALFEDIFQHDSFTGRSGTFFAYEGLGSIYWHMVSKLLLAAQENYLLAIEQKAEPETIQGLAECYYDIRKGLGFNKPPDEYGAFPTDPYSHTPKGQGAKQPGMTGQVKEEILTRQVELGLFIKNGQIILTPFYYGKDEFLTQPALSSMSISIAFSEHRITGRFAGLHFLPDAGHLSHREISGLQVHFSDGTVKEVSDSRLDYETSQHIFKRDGEISKIIVFLDQA